MLGALEQIKREAVARLPEVRPEAVEGSRYGRVEAYRTGWNAA